MKILINHKGNNNAEVLGANGFVCKIRTKEILEGIRDNKFKTVGEIYTAILGPDERTSDAEKLCIFYMVNRELENSAVIVVLPPKE